MQADWSWTHVSQQTLTIPPYPTHNYDPSPSLYPPPPPRYPPLPAPRYPPTPRYPPSPPWYPPAPWYPPPPPPRYPPPPPRYPPPPPRYLPPPPRYPPPTWYFPPPQLLNILLCKIIGGKTTTWSKIQNMFTSSVQKRLQSIIWHIFSFLTLLWLHDCRSIRNISLAWGWDKIKVWAGDEARYSLNMFTK